MFINKGVSFMNKKTYHAFPFLKKIYFVRTGGSKEELTAANLIKEEIAKLGGEATLESFEVNHSTITKAILKTKNPNMEIPCAGSGYSGYTDDNGVSGPLLDCSNKETGELFDLKDKILFSPTKIPPHPLYEKAIKDGAKAFIVTTGSVYKKEKDVDLDPYLLRDLNYSLGKIPVVLIRALDAERLLEKHPEVVNIVLQGIDDKATSHNVIADIKGVKHHEEVIALTAHYDSVSFSKGAYDNGTGVIALLQIYSYFKEHLPDRTLRFIFCGSEEMGLLGSKHYTNNHEEEIKQILFNINIDMVAATLGRDIACVSGEEKIVHYLEYLYKELGFAISAYQGVYSSDSTPFADKGVPAISFARLSNESVGAVIHSHDDVIERLSEENFLKTINFIIALLSRWANAIKFPVERKIPDDIKEKIDNYYFRKKDK